MGEPVMTPSLIAATSAKTWGAPFSTCLWVFTGAVFTANAWSSQLVVQPGSRTPNGSPLLQRPSPASCQPPQMAFPALPELASRAFPVPNGSAYDQS